MIPVLRLLSATNMINGRQTTASPISTGQRSTRLPNRVTQTARLRIMDNFTNSAA